MGRRMSAYYYSFEATGKDAVDKLLSAVACAGKAFHHTDCWGDDADPGDDHTGECPVAWIQNAADEASAEIERLKAENAALVEWVMARDWGEERDSILEQIEALQERYRTESAEGEINE
jgi:hypothetical protein